MGWCFPSFSFPISQSVSSVALKPRRFLILSCPPPLGSPSQPPSSFLKGFSASLSGVLFFLLHLRVAEAPFPLTQFFYPVETLFLAPWLGKIHWSSSIFCNPLEGRGSASFGRSPMIFFPNQRPFWEIGPNFFCVAECTILGNMKGRRVSPIRNPFYSCLY